MFLSIEYINLGLFQGFPLYYEIFQKFKKVKEFYKEHPYIPTTLSLPLTFTIFAQSGIYSCLHSSIHSLTHIIVGVIQSELQTSVHLPLHSSTWYSKFFLWCYWHISFPFVFFSVTIMWVKLNFVIDLLTSILVEQSY